MPVKPDFYYFETDGQVFLVRDKKLWRFPCNSREIPFRFKPVSLIPIADTQVLFAHPILKAHPHHWFHKDEVIGRPDIHSIVQLAVNRSLARGAAKVAIIEKGKVLMVKARRGITKGMWNLPGGFIGYGEHPSESARREVYEELGLRVTLGRLLGIYSEVFKRTGGYMLSFIYLGKRHGSKIRPHPEEIDEVRWMPVREALRITLNPFAKAGLRDYLKRTSSF